MEENNKKSDQSVEFAKERTFLASETTLMSWIRTSLTLIGFGIGIFEAIEKTEGKSTFKSSKLAGLGMVILGVVALTMAIKESRLSRQTLLKERFAYQSRSSLAVKIAYGLIIVGILGGIRIILNLVG